MGEHQRIAFLFAQSVAAMIEALGMQAENDRSKVMGETPMYGEDAFNNLINDYQLGANTAQKFLIGE